MFKRKQLISVNGQLRGSDLNNDWKYVTSDTLEEVIAADYFADVIDSLSVGDLIHVYFVQHDENGNDTSLYTNQKLVVVRISNKDSRHVAALPVGLTTKEVFLGNSSVGTSTTVSIPDGEVLKEAYCILDGKVDSTGDTNTVTIKSGSIALFTATITSATANGSIIAMTKNSSAEEDLFKSTDYSVENDGGAAQAHGQVAVVINTTV